MGCHGNHVFKYSQNKFIHGDFFSGGGGGGGTHRVPMNNSTHMETCPGVAR